MSGKVAVDSRCASSRRNFIETKDVGSGAHALITDGAAGTVSGQHPGSAVCWPCLSSPAGLMLGSMSCSGMAGGEKAHRQGTGRSWAFPPRVWEAFAYQAKVAGLTSQVSISSSLGIMAEVVLPPGVQAVPHHVDAAHGVLLCLPQPCPRAFRTARRGH